MSAKGSVWRQPASWLMAVGLGLARSTVWLPHRVRLGLGARLGELAWLLMGQRRRVTRTNLDACFPNWSQRRRRRLERDHFREAGRALLEWPLALWGSPRRLASLLDLEGVEHLEAGRASGPCVLLIAHVTMVELIGPFTHLISVPAAASITRDHRNPVLDRAVRKARSRYVDKTLEKKDTRGMIRWLRSGGALFYAPDQDFSFGAEFVDFFGVKAATTTATSRLVSKLGCAMIPTWLSRQSNGRYLLRFRPQPEGYPSADPLADARRVNAWIESNVVENPAQYLWMHRRFRNRPPGEPPFYPPAARRAKHR